MERSDIRAVRRMVAQRHRAEEHQTTARPIGITLIAGFQFLKAAVLLLTATLLQSKSEMVNGPNSPLSPLLYLATRGRYDSMNTALQGGSVLAGLILFLGLYLGAIGLGILSMSAWARRTLILNCGLTLALWAKSSLWPDPAASASPDMTNFTWYWRWTPWYSCTCYVETRRNSFRREAKAEPLVLNRGPLPS